MDEESSNFGLVAARLACGRICGSVGPSASAQFTVRYSLAADTEVAIMLGPLLFGVQYLGDCWPVVSPGGAAVAVH